MELALIETAISTGFEIASFINTVISDLRSTPAIIRKVSAQVTGITERLQHLRELSRTHIISPNSMEAWLRYQKDCNKTLRAIHDLLGAFSKGSKAKFLLFGSAVFQYFGPKEELADHIEDLKILLGHFDFLYEVMSKAPLVEQFSQNRTRASQEQPFLSLHQYVEMVLQKEASEGDDGKERLLSEK